MHVSGARASQQDLLFLHQCQFPKTLLQRQSQTFRSAESNHRLEVLSSLPLSTNTPSVTVDTTPYVSSAKPTTCSSQFSITLSSSAPWCSLLASSTHKPTPLPKCLPRYRSRAELDQARGMPLRSLRSFGAATHETLQVLNLSGRANFMPEELASRANHASTTNHWPRSAQSPKQERLVAAM